MHIMLAKLKLIQIEQLLERELKDQKVLFLKFVIFYIKLLLLPSQENLLNLETTLVSQNKLLKN